jgi:hypothetical protein
MEKVIKERFNGKYPARKSIQTNFAHVGVTVAVADKKNLRHEPQNDPY